MNLTPDLFAKDENLGLAFIALEATVKHNLKLLTNTFVTLHLTDIATKAGLSNSKIAEEFLFKMVSTAILYFSLTRALDSATRNFCCYQQELWPCPIQR